MGEEGDEVRDVTEESGSSRALWPLRGLAS